MESLCGSCHADTIKRQAKSVSKHEPVKKGECSSCHDPHASNNVFMTKGAYQYELCLSCHDWGKHSSHPSGEKSRDPRNKNLALGCTSCHRSHGTEFNKMFFYPTVTDVCTQCHEQFKR
jgi:predicted CXXCH cytochrome family protein